MIDSILGKLRDLFKHKQSMALCAVIVVMAFVIVGLIFSRSNGHDASKATLQTSSGHLSANKPTKANQGTDSTSGVLGDNTVNNKSITPATTPGAPTTTVLKATTNNDGTTTKEIVSNQPISFSTQTQNEVNLKRGTTQQVQAGQNGTETIVNDITYDQNGKEISRKTISDTVTKQAVSQITKIGVSDYNLNTDTWNGTEFGEMCLPGDYNTGGADGCIGTPSGQHFSAVNISGTLYVYCVSSVSGMCSQDAIVNVQPIIAIKDDNTFSYQSTTYLTDPRAGGGESQLLTSAICSQYGLACGSW